MTDLQNLVRFSSHPRPFQLIECYCDNPDCRCTDVFLTFTEVSPSGQSLKDPISFSASINLETWQVVDSSQRMPKVAAWLQEYLDQCPTSRRAEYKASFKQAKRDAGRKASFTIDCDEVLAGTLIPYNDILADKGALSSGGSNYAFEVNQDGRVYLVEDQYCPNPDCDCQSAHVVFFEVTTQADGGLGIHPRFHGRVTFAGRLIVEEQFACKVAEAEEVLAAWWKEHPHALKLLKAHYEDVKEIGQRSLAGPPLANPGVSRRAMETGQMTESLSLSDAPLPTGRVGRNAACPCGSGKKYKKCCMPKLALAR